VGTLTMRFIISFSRMLLGIVVGTAFIGNVPLYDMPFTGCTSYGFVTLEVGCTLWFDVLIGFGFVFLVACIGPKRWQPQLWAGAAVIIVASLGGLSAIQSGLHLNIFSHPEHMIYLWMGPGLATFLGGLLGVGLYYLLTLCLKSWAKS
jgi:hypothetical protein